MIYFRSDYSLGAHPRMLDALTRTNMVHTDGYALDDFCFEAIDLIKAKLEEDDVDVHFIPGGTQCNTIAISSFLRPHECAISPATGHICVHETGAIEATGHKIIHLPPTDGKILPEQIEDCVLFHEDEHMVKPKLVYISNSTEIGTIYTKAELMAIKEMCIKYDLYLYIDGARMAMALTSEPCDLELKDYPKIADAFYIGGTKNGAMMGEALVISNPKLKSDFRYLIKQKGAMLAKGRLMGVQFIEFFKDDFYLELGKHATEMGQLLAKGLAEKGYSFYVDSPTNQIFPIFKKKKVEELEENFFFYRWDDIDEENCAIRLVTSWATTEDEIIAFLKAV